MGIKRDFKTHTLSEKNKGFFLGGKEANQNHP